MHEDNDMHIRPEDLATIKAAAKEQLRPIVEAAFAEVVAETLAARPAGTVTAPTTAAAPSTPAPPTAPAMPTRRARKTAPAAPTRARRSPEALSALADHVAAYVAAHPGAAANDVAAACATTLAGLRTVWPVLRQAGRVHTTGAKTSTRYHPGAAPAAAKPGPAKARQRKRTVTPVAA